jgi:hypothetical protein
MDYKGFSVEDFMALPRREWSSESEYDLIVLIKTEDIHDSGYSCMAIIGVNDRKAVEIAADYFDHIEWKIDSIKMVDRFIFGGLNSDCLPESGGLRFWSNDNRKIVVGQSLSSVEISYYNR